jgi:hypothetical protein
MEYAVVRQSSSGSQDPSRKGGSDEWYNPKKSWWVVEYGGLNFFSSIVNATWMGSTITLGYMYWWES